MEIKKDLTIEAPLSVVWKVLTMPEHIEKWLGVKAESKWNVNDDLFFKFSWDGKKFVDKGKLIGFDENKLFSYSYWSNFSGLPDKPENYSKIRFDLNENGKQTLLKLTHSEINNQTMYEHSEKNWEETLGLIKMIAESYSANMSPLKK